MFDAVFISDLHLHPDETVITERFFRFMAWAENHTRSLYILGDFFHAWPGDDALDPWSMAIVQQLATLTAKGIDVFFMAGNRDFLIGHHLLNLAGVKRLTEPTVIALDNKPILLVHGDRYCTLDKSHQWLRRVTRNPIFSWLFLRLTYTLRDRIVNKIRYHSHTNQRKTSAEMDVVPAAMLSHMQALQCRTLVHGHTHKPGLTVHEYQGDTYQQYVLSDWDDAPHILCYDKSNSLHYHLFGGEV